MSVALARIALLASADLTAAEVMLRNIPNDDPDGCFREIVLGQLRNKTATFAQIIVEDKIIGHTIYSIDTFPGGHRELVSIATRCHHKTIVRHEIDEALTALARLKGCKSIRLHTVRHGLIKEALFHGWEISEIVIRKHL